MTPQHRLAVLNYYHAFLAERGYAARREPDGYRPVLSRVDPALPSHDRTPYEHAAWMCATAVGMLVADDVEKVDRWLGHIQGILYMGGFFSHAEERAHSRPPERGGGPPT